MLSRLEAGLPVRAPVPRVAFTADALHEIPFMSSAEYANLDFARRFNRGLQGIAAARGTDAVLLATVRAAHELADASGLCAVSNDEPHCVVSTIEDAAVTLLDGNSSLPLLVTSASQAEAASVQYRPLIEVELPVGRRLRAEMLLTVPLGADSGYIGLAFFWLDGSTPSVEQLALLPGLAWTSCLALRSQRDASELRRSRVEQRSRLIAFEHRARNVLAWVRSIIRLSGQMKDSPEEFASHLEGRISALSRTQAALIVDGNAELEDLIRTELIANAVRDEQLAIAGPSLRLTPHTAETIALTLHELTTNALKFGALAVRDGRIAVNWHVDSASSTLHWSWIESHVRVVQTAPQRRGFGRELIERVLPYELGAVTRLTIAADGARCEIDLPINDRTTSMAGRAADGGRISL